MKLQEFNSHRVYIAAQFDPLDSQQLIDWTNSLGIKAINSADLHSSILVSVDSNLTYENFKPNTNLHVPIDLTYSKLEIFPMSNRGTVPSSTGQALVITFDSDWLVNRRIEIQKQYGITSSSYRPHMTLSYDWDSGLGIDLNSLELPIDEIIIISEYKEQLKS